VSLWVRSLAMWLVLLVAILLATLGAPWLWGQVLRLAARQTGRLP